MLDTNRLRVFRAVVASGSVQAAASYLGYTPSAVSQQLSALQRETGLVLVERSGRGIRPTPVGVLLADRSEEVMSSLARLDGLVEDLRVGRSGNLTIGCFASAAQSWIPPVAKALREEFPDVLVMLNLNEVGGRPDSAERPDIDIRNERLDEETTHAGYGRRVLHEEGYGVLLREDHPLAGEATIALSRLADADWIEENVADNVCGRIVRDAFRAAGFSPRRVARTEDHYTAASLVAAGVGVSAVPRLAANLLPPEVVFRPIEEPAPHRRTVAFVRHGVESAAPAARALELLEQTVRRSG